MPINPADYMPRRSAVDLSPRKGIVPKPFDAARAQAIWDAARKATNHGGVYENLDVEMTPEENAYVLAVWDTIPSGSSCYMSAWWAIQKDQFLP